MNVWLAPITIAEQDEAPITVHRYVRVGGKHPVLLGDVAIGKGGAINYSVGFGPDGSSTAMLSYCTADSLAQAKAAVEAGKIGRQAYYV